jgi:hypothetical protein
MSEHRRPHRVLTVATGVALMTAAGAALLPTRAVAQTDFDVVNGTANAGAAYIVYFNGSFANFSPGVVGSTFPLAHAHLDSAPSSQATASPADWGPAGGTAVGAYNANAQPPAPSPLTQPQYADTRYPPGSSKPVTFGNPPGPYATAMSGHDGASARAGGVDTTTPQPASATNSNRASAFNTAMSAWRAKYMSSSASAQHPAAAGDPGVPAETDGDLSSSSVSLDATKGVVSTGDARVHRANFGNGVLVLYDLHTAVTITNSGTPHADIVTTIGEATVGGVPVSIGKDGVVVGSAVLATPDAVGQASARLNGVLASAGIQVSALAPQVVTSASQETVTATAVSVILDQPGPPENKVIYNLGNVFTDDLAVPSRPFVSIDTSLLGGGVSSASTLTPPTTTADSGASTTSPLPASVTPPAGVSPSSPTMIPLHPKKTLPIAPAAASPAPKPMWLLAAYLFWQALIIATLASLWWWRNSARRLPSPGTRR